MVGGGAAMMVGAQRGYSLEEKCTVSILAQSDSDQTLGRGESAVTNASATSWNSGCPRIPDGVSHVGSVQLAARRCPGTCCCPRQI